MVGYGLIKVQLRDLIAADHPGFGEEDFISQEQLSGYRRQYLDLLMKSEDRDLTAVDVEVMDAIHNNELLSQNIEPVMEEQATLGQRVADNIAVFGGSWTFIIIFFSFLLVWMLINIVAMASRAFDPYPFILLNLILSCLAAIQAPIIMMSQNRKETKDRARSEQDYKVNLKAELEIRLLNEKIDHLIIHQNQRLLEIQELQLDYLEELAGRN